MAKQQRKSVGHVRIFVGEISINGEKLAGVDVDTDIREGETIFEAIGRAHAETQQSPVKRVRSKARRKD